MDIVFLIPREHPPDLQYSMDNLLTRRMEMVPLGIFYMATILKQNGYSVEVVDFSTFESNDEIQNCLNRIISAKPKIIGISTTTPTYPKGKELAHKIREELKDSTIVLGGYHVTFLPEEPLIEGIADIVVRGEGEYAMLEITRYYMENKGDLNLINGISYLSKDKVIHNSPPILRIKKLDELPFPDRDLVDYKNYRNPGTIISSRGCVARCQFCPAGAFGAISLRSPENIVNEIKQLHLQYGFRHISFVDNTFTTFKDRIFSIFNKIRDEGLDLNFVIESRVSLVNETYIKGLAESNVVLIQFGVETGNAGIMNDIRKKITLEQVENAVDLSIKYGMNVITSFIIGHPSDTVETVRDTINFAKKLVRKGVQTVFSVLTPFPGTNVFINRKELGIEIIDWDFTKWNLSIPVIRTKNLSKRDLKTLLTMATSETNAILNYV